MSVTRRHNAAKFYDEKFCNMLRWIVRTTGKYSDLEGGLLPVVAGFDANEQINQLLLDADKRAQLIDPNARYLVTRNESARNLLLVLRELYYMSDDKRTETTEEVIKAIKATQAFLEKTLNVLENNKEQLPEDLKTLGAYVTIFFEDYLMAK